MARTTPLDDPLRAAASKLIKTYGKTIVIKTFTASVYDETTGESTNTVTSSTVKGAITSPTKEDLSDGSVQSGDIIILLAAKDTRKVPKPTDTAVVDGATYRILHVETQYSGELPATYKVFARA